MYSFVRKIILFLVAAAALFFVSCADKKSSEYALPLNDTYSYLLCDADSTCADAEANFLRFKKLYVYYRNLEKLADNNG